MSVFNGSVHAAYLRKFINFSVSLDTGTIAKGFWERYAHILSSYDVSKDRTELFLNMPISLFAGIDARTQERVMERMITLHKLSFEGCTSAAVLYFELIYQAIMVRDPTLDSFAWFIHTGSQENKYLRNVIGQQVWEYLTGTRYVG